MMPPRYTPACMKYVLLIALLCLTAVVPLLAQNATPAPGFRITGAISGVRDSTVMLAHWFGSNTYIPKDTARADSQGRFVFEGSKTLPQGLYLVLPPSRRDIGLHLIVTDDQTFSFATDTANVIKAMKVTGSTENELFFEYQQQLSKLYDEAQALNVQKKLRTDMASIATVNQQTATLQKKAQTQRQQFLATHSNTFAVSLLKASAEPEVPPVPKAANGRPDSGWVFNHYKSHFWDGYDFADERLVRTPVLQRKLDRYLKELTVQQPDSLIREADFLVGKALAGKSTEVKSYVIWYITSQYEQPKVMGTDGLYVHMFEKYYATGIMPTTDTSTVRKIGERVATLKPTLVGKVMVSPAVSDTLRKPIVLSGIKADYTVVYFYAPHCGHCRDSAPKLKKFIDDYKPKGVEVLAIAVEDSPEEWKKFIREFKLEKAINGFDYTHRANFRLQYDVWSTPTVYVLDKTKTIVARRLPVEDLENFILFFKKQQEGRKSTVATVKADAAIKK